MAQFELGLAQMNPAEVKSRMCVSKRAKKWSILVIPCEEWVVEPSIREETHIMLPLDALVDIQDRSRCLGTL